jgi:hypothetical protein
MAGILADHSNMMLLCRRCASWRELTLVDVALMYREAVVV